MNKSLISLAAFCFTILWWTPIAPAENARNPILWADVPDLAIVRVDDTYYMSSTTMHMSPGLPIMKSRDLVNWELAGYAYDTLGDNDALTLQNGRNAYGAGSWASSLRFRDGEFYVSTFSSTTGKTYVFKTKDPAKSPWTLVSAFPRVLHDHSLFFDDDGRVYMVNGAGDIRLTELATDLSGLKPGGVDQVIIPNASRVAGENVGLPAEGSQMRKINGKYYLFNITWPRGGMRTEIVHRADKITGPYEGRVVLQDQGVAQGGLIDTPRGEWFAYLFQDHGAVGRIPYLVPVTWKDGWPVLGVNGKVPAGLPLPASTGLSNLIASDEFNRKPGEPALSLAWQWNHNPDNAHWSLTARPGALRLTTGAVVSDFLAARNTLTQRTFGPESSATTAIDVTNMKDGDFAGLGVLQQKYGLVGVKMVGNTRSIVMVGAESDSPRELASVPLEQKTVFLRVDCDFKERADKASFAYSLDGKNWTPIGQPLHMVYTLPHFMGYRFALFNYATKAAGGSVDFDFFRVSNRIPAGLVLTAAGALAQPQPGKATLKDVYRNDFLIGAALNDAQFSDPNSPDVALITSQFDAISPENAMKWEPIEPRPGQFNFGPADRYVAFGMKHHMFVVGHTLVWHSQTPAWVFEKSPGQPADRATLLKRMRDHIFAVVGRYKGRVKGWDVVNEALAEDGTLRDSPWRQILGDNFIVQAFQFAHQADPGAELYYNDYGLENPQKRAGALGIVRKLKAAGVPITGVGIQDHVNLDWPAPQILDAAIKDFGRLGVKVMITELDVDVLPGRSGAVNADVSRREAVDSALDPYPAALPGEMQRRLARRYAELFGVYLANRDVVSRVTFWGVTDRNSWLNGFPIRGRTNYPLLFGRDGRPKPAYDAVIGAHR